MSCRSDLNESAGILQNSFCRFAIFISQLLSSPLRVSHVVLHDNDCRCCARVVVRECSLRFFESTSLSRIVKKFVTFCFSPLGRFPHSLTHSRDNTQHTHRTESNSNSIDPPAHPSHMHSHSIPPLPLLFSSLHTLFVRFPFSFCIVFSFPPSFVVTVAIHLVIHVGNINTRFYPPLFASLRRRSIRLD